LTRIELIGVEGLPEIKPGDDLADLIGARFKLQAGDVVVIAQKVVSKAEGRMRYLKDVVASDEAVRLAPHLVAAPDPRFVQVVLDESVRVLRTERVLITADPPWLCLREQRRRPFKHSRFRRCDSSS